MPKGGEKTKASGGRTSRKRKPGNGSVRKRVSLPVRQIKSVKVSVKSASIKTVERPKSKEERRQAVKEAISYEETRGKSGKISSVNLMPAEPRVKSVRPNKPEPGRRSGWSAPVMNPTTAAKLKVQADPVKVERAKRMMMWSGVIFFMLLISGGWLYNLERSFNQNKIENSGSSTSEWSDLTADLSDKLEQMKSDLSELRSFSTNNDGATGTLPQSGNTPFLSSSTPILSPAEIEAFKNKVESLSTTTESPGE